MEVARLHLDHLRLPNSRDPSKELHHLGHQVVHSHASAPHEVPSVVEGVDAELICIVFIGNSVRFLALPNSGVTQDAPSDEVVQSRCNLVERALLGVQAPQPSGR